MAKRKRTNSSSNEAVPAEATHLLDLNDDCMLEFLAYLPTKDLCAMKKTCPQFEALAAQAFARRYRHRPFVFAPEFHADEADFWTAFEIVYQFGKFIRQLSVHHMVDDTAELFWEHISRWCIAVQELKVTGCALTALCDTSSYGRRVKTLKLINCSGANADVLSATLRMFSRVEQLTIEYGRQSLHLESLNWNWPTLKEITIRGSRKNVNKINDALPAFIKANPQLKKINFNFNYVKCNLLSVIADHSPALESLSLQLYDRNGNQPATQLTKLCRLSQLRELQITGAAFEGSIAPSIGGFVELHTLSISDTVMNAQLCRAICKLVNLKTLKLVEMEADSFIHASMESFAKTLNLEHFHLVLCKGIKLEHIFAIIKHAKALKTLVFLPPCKCGSFVETKSNQELFSGLMAARDSSGATSVLEIFLPSLHSEDLNEKHRGQMPDVERIQLKTIDSETELDYVQIGKK